MLYIKLHWLKMHPTVQLESKPQASAKYFYHSIYHMLLTMTFTPILFLKHHHKLENINVNIC